MMVRWKRRPAFELLAMPAIRTFVETADRHGFAAFTKYFSHGLFVPIAATGTDGKASEGPSMSIRALAAALLFALSSSVCAVAATSVPTYDQAQALMNKNDFKGAIALLDRLLQADPKNVKALVLRGDAKDDAGDPTSALADYTAAIALNPDFAYAYATRCDTQTELEHYDDAVTDCTKALTLDSSNELALRARSKAYYFRGDYQLALADAQQVVSLDPTDARAQMTACRAQFGAEQYDRARDACSKTITYAPDEENAYFYRGRSALQQKQYEPAIADLSKAVTIDSEFTGAHYWLSEAEYGATKYGQALSEIDSYMLAYPHDPDALMLRAHINEKLGKADAAKYDASEALRQFKIANDSDGMKAAQAFIDALKP